MVRVAGCFVAWLVFVAAAGTPVAMAAKRSAAKTEGATKPATPKKPPAAKVREAEKRAAEAEQLKDFIAKVDRFLQRAKGALAESGLERSDLKRMAFWVEELRASVAARHWDDAEAYKNRITALLKRGAKAAEASARKAGKEPAATPPTQTPQDEAPKPEDSKPEAPQPTTETATPEADAGAGSGAP